MGKTKKKFLQKLEKIHKNHGNSPVTGTALPFLVLPGKFLSWCEIPAYLIVNPCMTADSGTSNSCPEPEIRYFPMAVIPYALSVVE